MQSITWKSIAAFGCVLALPLAAAPVLAQDQAGIAGDVTDETDAALPGVTVTVASSALIERARTAVTDGTGNYQIIVLPPGTYSVTFTLDGFNTVVREGVVLTGAFTAPVDATLPVGELTESVTVTTAPPLVDIVSTRQQTVQTAERINALPGAAGIYWGGDYVPGVEYTFGMATIHGSDRVDSQPAYDGVKSGTLLLMRGEWPGASVGAVENEASITEIVFDTSSQNAEFALSGVRTNVIPKAGGNNFSFDIFASGTADWLQSDNQSPELKEPPFNFQFAPNDYIWTFNPAVGGPILENKLWFFASVLEYRNKNYGLDQFFDPAEPSTPEGLDGDLRVFNNNRQQQQTVRLTYQPTPRNKLMFSAINQLDRNDRVTSHFSGVPVDAEAAYTLNQDPIYMVVGRWTAPLTSRLLVEADVSFQRTSLVSGSQDHGGEIRIPKTDLVTGQNWSNTANLGRNKDYRRHLNASVSYVTGSHNVKAGLSYQNNYTDDGYDSPGGVYQSYFFAGAPNFLLLTGPDNSRMNINCDCGLYVQDAWTMDRLTLNGGFRYDWFNSSVRGGSHPAGIWTPAVELSDPFAEDVPDWEELQRAVRRGLRPVRGR